MNQKQIQRMGDAIDAIRSLLDGKSHDQFKCAVPFSSTKDICGHPIRNEDRANYLRSWGLIPLEGVFKELVDKHRNDATRRKKK